MSRLAIITAYNYHTRMSSTHTRACMHVCPAHHVSPVCYVVAELISIALNYTYRPMGCRLATTSSCSISVGTC